jgi:hypothetical protein
VKKNTPRVSIIIVNWNGKENLKTCLDSLALQSFKDFEVILLDNASSDGSAEFMEKFYPWVRLIKSDMNLGFAKGNNKGFEFAKGEYIVTLNNDTEADSHWLGELVRCLDEHPEAGFCASKMLNFYNRQLIDRAGDYYTIAGTAVMNGANEFDGEKFNRKHYIFGACAGGAIYKRRMIEEIGFFDEDFYILHEDVDLDFRAQLTDYKCVFVPTALLYHKSGSSLKKVSSKSLYYGYRNLEFVYIKNFPTILMVYFLVFHLIYFFLSFLISLFILKPHIFIKAKFDVIMNLNVLLKKRRIIQKNRKVSNSYLFSVLLKDWITPLIERRINFIIKRLKW